MKLGLGPGRVVHARSMRRRRSRRMRRRVPVTSDEQQFNMPQWQKSSIS